MSGEALENLSHEDRVFPPSEKFAAQANGKADLYESAKSDREGFWKSKQKICSGIPSGVRFLIGRKLQYLNGS
jgi:hypothetical protein